MAPLHHSTLADPGNGGVIAVAVLAVLLVALSAYGRRLCRHPAVRFLVCGASTVLLPLSSTVLLDLESSVKEDIWTLLLWLVLVLIVKCSANIAATASSSPAEGDADASSDGYAESLAAYVWMASVIWLCVPAAGWLGHLNRAIFFLFCAAGFAKPVLKLAAFYSASGSLALGENPRLIAGYMEQLAADGDDGGLEQVPVPRYIVMGEKKKHIDKTRPGYRVKRDALRQDKSSGLVTLDRVWRLAENGDGILAGAGRVELRDLCLSYSLFKILRLALSAEYPLADAAGSSEALSFVLRGMDSAGGTVNADRMFRVLKDELWFASDFYYYSPIPLCILGRWWAALNCICSVLIIAGAVAVGWIYEDIGVIHSPSYKLITHFLLLTVVLVEAREIVAGMCSNWTKMALLGHYIGHQSLWRRSSCVHAALAAVLRLRPARRWRYKLGQNSLLEPRRFIKSIQVSPFVRDAMLRSLVSSYGGGSRSGKKVDWSQKGWAWNDADRSSSSTERILVWHVATRLLEVKSTSASSSPDMIAACHLSYYCAYLVAEAPELLPDSAEWTRRRYKQVSDDVLAALAGVDGGTELTAERYERLLAELSKDSRDTVLPRGAELGRHLVEGYAEDEASAWRILADFWSEMLLFVAPSENVKGHVRAMVRGGEFITLVWALLLHAGVTTRRRAVPSPIQ